jgi:hypothetical protein
VAYSQEGHSAGAPKSSRAHITLICVLGCALDAGHGAVGFMFALLGYSLALG